jgi:ribose 5-phosphate isomerase A
MGDSTDIKRRLGAEAVDRFATDGMKLGLGTGTTAIWAVRRLAERLRAGFLKGVSVVTTSLQSELEARSLGLSVLTLNDLAMEGGLDLTIDGADEVDPERNLIKGAGGAMLLEKIVAYASRRLLIIVDESKLTTRLGERFPVPIEAVPAALATASRSLQALGARVTVRTGAGKAGPIVTDLGNLLLDAAFGSPFPPREREAELKLIPGVLESGLFTRKRPELLIGFADGRIEYRA